MEVVYRIPAPPGEANDSPFQVPDGRHGHGPNRAFDRLCPFIVHQIGTRPVSINGLANHPRNLWITLSKRFLTVT